MKISRNNNNAALGFVFVTVLLDVIGFGIIFPIIPKLISRFVGGDIGLAAEYGGWLIFAYALMQFLCAPILGNLSDSYGRRPVLLLSLFALGIDCIFMAFAPSLFWLFIGRLIGGMTGGCHSVASAYVADISTPEKRSQNFGMLNAAFGLGFIIGPVLGGLLAQWGTHVPFLVAATLSMLNVAYGYFILPESLSDDKRRKFEWRRANPIGSFLHLRKFPVIAGLLIAYTFVYFAGHSMNSVWAYFSIAKFDWNEQMIGYSLGFMGFTFALVQGVLMRFILPKIGDKRAVYIGLLIESVTLLAFAFVTQSWMMFALCIPYALSGIASPALQAITSNQIPESAQGELQGGIASLISITAILSPPIMTYLFAAFSDEKATIHFPGMPFAFAAFLILIGFVLAVRALRKY